MSQAHSGIQRVGWLESKTSQRESGRTLGREDERHWEMDRVSHEYLNKTRADEAKIEEGIRLVDRRPSLREPVADPRASDCISRTRTRRRSFGELDVPLQFLEVLCIFH